MSSSSHRVFLIGSKRSLSIGIGGISRIICYKANFDTQNDLEIGDIDSFTSQRELVQSLPDFDLLTAGFPCQAFSMMGRKLGFNDIRGNIFYSIIKVLQVKHPEYVLLENVRNLKRHDNGNTFIEITRSLREDAGYTVFDDVFNTADFGLPQTRRRVFLLAIRNDLVPIINGIAFEEKEVKREFNHLNGFELYCLIIGVGGVGLVCMT